MPVCKHLARVNWSSSSRAMYFREVFVCCSSPAFGFLLLSGYHWRDRFRKLPVLVAWLCVKSGGTKDWRSLSTTRRLRVNQRERAVAWPLPGAWPWPLPEAHTLPVRVRRGAEQVSLTLTIYPPPQARGPHPHSCPLPLAKGQCHCPLWISISKGQPCLTAFWLGNSSLQGLRKACLGIKGKVSQPTLFWPSTEEKISFFCPELGFPHRWHDCSISLKVFFIYSLYVCSYLSIRTTHMHVSLKNRRRCWIP